MDEPAYRSSSPPVPTIKNRGKKKKTNDTRVKNSPLDDARQLPARSPANFDSPNDTRSRGNEIDELDENENEYDNDDEKPMNNQDDEIRKEHQNDQPASPRVKPTVEKKKGLPDCLLKLFDPFPCRFALHRTAYTQKETAL